MFLRVTAYAYAEVGLLGVQNIFLIFAPVHVSNLLNQFQGVLIDASAGNPLRLMDNIITPDSKHIVDSQIAEFDESILSLITVKAAAQEVWYCLHPVSVPDCSTESYRPRALSFDMALVGPVSILREVGEVSCLPNRSNTTTLVRSPSARKLT